ncbi:uncharacterized protein [Rutidosis leptorrhynchoides]|uniref:uncharacterized protein n=1 Tax=Rutidosis leptorrhynchoides TaxID=125765 RepID=UPI003A9A0A80
MASISSQTKTSCHARSISLPSTLDQSSLFSKKLFQDATSCTSSLSLDHKLNGLNGMYESIESFLTFPTSQRLLGTKQQVNELLDELVELLDLCSTTKDALSMSIDAAKELQSVLRRKRGDNVGLTSSIREYISVRKNVKNLINKSISRLRKQGSLFTNDEGTTPNVNALKEMGPNTCVVFESLLNFISGSSSQSKIKGWFLVSKILGNKRLQCNQVLEKDEIKRVDDELLAVFSHKGVKSACLDVEVIRERLAEMEFTLQNLDEQVECLFRHLIKTRVCLLNMYNC